MAREVKQERLFEVPEVGWSERIRAAARGLATFFSFVSIGVVVAVSVGALVALALWLLLRLLPPLPYDPPWDWVPDEAWHWGVTWIGLGGLAGGVGVWVANKTVQRIGWGPPGVSARPVVWGLGAVCAVLAAVGLVQLAGIAEEEQVDSFKREAVAPERVCQRDPDLRSESADGVTTYDTNGNGTPDVMTVDRPRGRTFAVMIDTIESGQWASEGGCIDGEFRSAPFE